MIHEISPRIDAWELAQLFSWLKAIEYAPEVYGNNDTTQVSAYQIRRFASALQVSSEVSKAMLANFIEPFDKINNWELDHAEFDYYSTSSIGFDIPLPISEFEQMPVEEQFRFLEKYPPTDDAFDTNANGLALVLNNTIIGDPEKYRSHLSELFPLDPFYLAEILRTYAQVTRNGDLDYWKELLKLIDANILAIDAPVGPGSKARDHLLYSIASLLLVISERPSGVELSKEEITFLIELIIKLLSTNRTMPTKLMERREWHSARLNSMAGKGYETLMNLNKLWDDWEENRGIHPLLKEFLESKLKRSGAQEQEFSLALGHYFSYLLSADANWCQQEKENIFPVDDPIHLKLTSASLLLASEMIYGNVIRFLRANELNPFLIRLYPDEGMELHRLCQYALTELSYFDQDAMEHQDSLIYLYFPARVRYSCQLSYTRPLKYKFFRRRC